MKNKKVLIIGIDSMDRELLLKFEDSLPTFKKLKKMSPNIDLKSVFPPDSITAWATIYTGQNPAKHGAVFFVDPRNPFDKVGVTATGDLDNTFLGGKTFWDIASKSGKKVCIVFPHIGYPPWKVNGIMVGRSVKGRTLKGGDAPPILSYPEDIARNASQNLNKLEAKAFRDDFDRYIKLSEELVFNEMEFSLKLLAKSDWDLFFTYSDVLDGIQHYFWSYFDENDPLFPRDNEYKCVIKKFYKIYDRVVSEYLNAVDLSEYAVIILSDHGHYRRPAKIVNFNKILLEMGLLYKKSNGIMDVYKILSKLKKIVAKISTRGVLGKMIISFAYKSKKARKLYAEKQYIDWEKTIASACDMSGIKEYSYGGIKIYKHANNEEIREKIIQMLRDLKDYNGKPIVKWVCKREEMYEGEYIEKYPDIIFELFPEYGVGLDIYDEFISDSKTHHIQPGGHRLDTPVIFISTESALIPVKQKIELMDIASTILSLLGVKTNVKFDGQSIFKM